MEAMDIHDQERRSEASCELPLPVTGPITDWQPSPAAGKRSSSTLQEGSKDGIESEDGGRSLIYNVQIERRE
jgi:hypothetical protein